MMLKSTKVRLLYGLAFAFIISASVDLAVSDPCTPETCPDGPVVVVFPLPDCAGEYIFQSVDGSWFQCEPSFHDGSHMATYNNDYVESSIYDDPFCGGGIPYPALRGTRYYIGSCMNHFGDFASDKSASLHNSILPPALLRDRGNFSYMYLRNAKQPFKTPQRPFVDPNTPNPPLKRLECSNIKDCEAKGMAFTGYFNQHCSVADLFKVLNVSASTCSRSFQPFYQNYRCVNKHTVEIRLSQNSDCSNPFQSNLYGGVCGLAAQTTYCNESPKIKFL